MASPGAIFQFIHDSPSGGSAIFVHGGVAPVIMRNFYSSSRILSWLGVAAVALAVTACASRVNTRGNLPDPERIAEIKTGQHSRQDVADILGSPSSTAVFDLETWYYISKRTETVAFFESELQERQVLVLRFDDNGVVSTVESLGIEDGRLLQPVERETPTAGNKMGFFEQIIGNLGRFNK